MQRWFGAFLILAVVAGAFITHGRRYHRLQTSGIRHASLSGTPHWISPDHATVDAKRFLPHIWPQLHSGRSRLDIVTTRHQHGPAWLVPGCSPLTCDSPHDCTTGIHLKTGRPADAPSAPAPLHASTDSQNP